METVVALLTKRNKLGVNRTLAVKNQLPCRKVAMGRVFWLTKRKQKKSTASDRSRDGGWPRGPTLNEGFYEKDSLFRAGLSRRWKSVRRSVFALSK
jgi:hypothetical protein